MFYFFFVTLYNFNVHLVFRYIMKIINFSIISITVGFDYYYKYLLAVLVLIKEFMLI